jgi:hypothetical protein
MYLTDMMRYKLDTSAQNRVKWWALVNKEMDLQISKDVGNF